MRGGQDISGRPPQPERGEAKGDPADDLDALLDRLQLASGRSSGVRSAGAATDARCIAAGGWQSC